MAATHAFIRPDPTAALILLQRKIDGAFIPIDPANADYRAYLALNQPADPAPAQVTAIVLAVNPVALRYVLRHTPDPKNAAGTLLAAVDALLANPLYNDQQDAWQHAVTMLRADLLTAVGTLGTLLGINAGTVDTLLTQAAARPQSGAIWGPPPS